MIEPCDVLELEISKAGPIRLIRCYARSRIYWQISWNCHQRLRRDGLAAYDLYDRLVAKFTADQAQRLPQLEKAGCNGPN